MRKNVLKDKMYLVAAVVLSLAMICGVLTEYFSQCGKIRSEVLRLHVLAASDSEEDQRIKLTVRDEILKNSPDIFGSASSFDEAEKNISEHLTELCNTANAVLKKENVSYSASAELVCEYFDVREYDGVTLPAGKYNALKVVLGDGKGKNWWCVMFPPLCLPAVTDSDSDVFDILTSDDGTKVVAGKSEYKVRFKIVEIAEKIRSYFDK